MKLEHVAIWCHDLEKMKAYYIRFFQGVPNLKYHNATRAFESYFLTFASGARLELMSMPGIPDNLNDTVSKQHKGLIHIAFGANSMQEVDAKALELGEEGYSILSGPRITGDGYYEFETLDPEQNRVEVTFKTNLNLP